jgi:hypothetical protein
MDECRNYICGTPDFGKYYFSLIKPLEKICQCVIPRTALLLYAALPLLLKIDVKCEEVFQCIRYINRLN